MAYINVAEWSSDQVTDWLKGLDNSMYHYVQSFTNNEVGGKQLLNIRPYELEQLGMLSIGHQEIVLEAVEYLKNFNYNLDKENLQFLALHVASAAQSLFKQLKYSDQTKLETQILKDITRTIAAVKPLIGWLDRAPFRGQKNFDELRTRIMQLGLEMATMAMRDRFSVKPVETIRSTAEKLGNMADYIIQDISDPMVLQPASLELVTLKKRESDLGFLIMPSLNGIHSLATDAKCSVIWKRLSSVDKGITRIAGRANVIWEKIDERKQAKAVVVIARTKATKEHTRQKYADLEKAVKRSCRRDKRAWTDSLADEGEKAANNGDMRLLYDVSRRLCGTRLNTRIPVKNRSGQLITDPAGQLK